MDENYTKVIYPETARGDEDTQDRETRTTTKRYFKDDSLNNPKLWEAMGEWGKETNLLTQEERSVIWNVCQVMDDDWFLERSERKSAEEIAQKAFGLGFQFDPSDEIDEKQHNSVKKDTKEQKEGLHQKTEREEHKEPDDDIDFASSISADTWFALTRWAKSQGHFQGWERKLLYHIGIRVSRNINLTSNQARQARRLYQEALNRGYHNP